MTGNPQWEYMTVLVTAEILDYETLHVKSVNGQELKDWKKIDLTTVLRQIGTDHWEMTGTISIPRGEVSTNYLFFKRIKP